MTSLAIRGSRFHNGVSRLRSRYASDMLQELWPQVPPDENPIDYVTNGVHVPTFLALEWVDLFDRFLGPGWAERMHNRTTREGIEELPITSSGRCQYLVAAYMPCGNAFGNSIHATRAAKHTSIACCDGPIPTILPC